MPLPQPPLSSLLAWLTVSVLLLAGSPARQPTAGEAGSQRRATLEHQFADTFATLDLEPARDPGLRSLSKLRNWFDTPAASRVPIPARRSARRCDRRPADVTAPTRLSLFGFAELRL